MLGQVYLLRLPVLTCSWLWPKISGVEPARLLLSEEQEVKGYRGTDGTNNL